MSLLDVQRELLATLTASQHWSRTEIALHQRHRLERLIKHARDRVPFYRTRLDPVLTAQGEINWDNWSALPTVTRLDMYEQGPDLLSTAVPPGHGQVTVAKTSGSTGIRIAISQSELAGYANQAAAFRGQAWFGLDWSKNILYLLGSEPGVDTLESRQAMQVWGPRWIPDSTGRQYILNRYQSAPDVLEFIAKNDIRYLVTRPVEAHALALEARSLQSSVRLGAIIGVGTEFRPVERADCINVFGCSVINPYGAKEGGQMAFPCPFGNYHVNEEVVRLEIVDEENQPCEIGQVGRVLVTPLYNFAQPLIRYEQGDLAVLGGPCECGRSLKTLQEIVGRQEQLFQFEGGRKFSMTVHDDIMEKFGAARWQIAQVSSLAVEVRFVPAAALGDPGQVEAAIKAKAQRDDIAVSFRQLQEMPRAAGGKHLFYVNEAPQDHATRT